VNHQDGTRETSLRSRAPFHYESMPKVVLILADSHAILRMGVRALLAREPEFEIIEVADAEGLIEQATRIPPPDVALIDVDLPPHGASAAVVALREYGTVPIVWSYPSRLTPEVVYDAVRLGAAGVLRKDISAAGLVRSLRAIVNGEAPLCRDLTASLVARIQLLDSQAVARSQVFDLSRREQEVLALIADGQSNKAIAADLRISQFTAKRHVQNILNKLGLHNRGEAAARFRSAAEEMSARIDPAATRAPA
jgi:two-component system, NarL family, nitrate/nitrite response regulator NarL